MVWVSGVSLFYPPLPPEPDKAVKTKRAPKVLLCGPGPQGLVHAILL